jgi:LPS export ABC transporter protein LptC
LRTDPSWDASKKALQAGARAKRAKTWAALLGAVAVFGAIGLVLQLGWFRAVEAPPVTISTTQGKAVPDVSAQPTAYATELTGVDDRNLPYEITAKTAVQDTLQEKTVNLETVVGHFAKSGTETMDVKSDRAQFETQTKTLNLEGGVEIKSASKMTATMDKASVDVVTRRLESRSPVKVLIDGGEVTADHLVVDNNGETIKFKGRVKASLGGDAK